MCVGFAQATPPRDSEPHWLLWMPVQGVCPSLCPVGGVLSPQGVRGGEEAGFHFLGTKSPLNGRGPKVPPHASPGSVTPGTPPELQVRREVGRGDGCPRVGLLGPPRRPAQADSLPGQSAHEALTPLRLQEAPSRLPQLPGPRASPASDHIPPASAQLSWDARLVASLSQILLPFLSGGRQWLDLGSTLNPGPSYLQALNHICHVHKVTSTGTRGQDADSPSLGRHSTNCTAIPHSGKGELWSG